MTIPIPPPQCVFSNNDEGRIPATSGNGNSENQSSNGNDAPKPKPNNSLVGLLSAAISQDRLDGTNNAMMMLGFEPRPMMQMQHLSDIIDGVLRELEDDDDLFGDYGDDDEQPLGPSTGRSNDTFPQQ